jgi:hypothetical protein
VAGGGLGEVGAVVAGGGLGEVGAVVAGGGLGVVVGTFGVVEAGPVLVTVVAGGVEVGPWLGAVVVWLEQPAGPDSRRARE